MIRPLQRGDACFLYPSPHREFLVPINIRWNPMIVRFHLAVFSLTGVAILLLLVVLVAGKLRSDPYDAFIYVIVVFGFSNQALASWLFYPVYKVLSGQATAASTLRRIDALPGLLGASVIFLTIISVLPPLFVTHLICEACPLDDLSWATMLGLFSVPGLYSIFLGAFMYFLMGDYVVQLRKHLFEQGIETPSPDRGQVGVTLFVAFLSVTAVPIALSAIEEYFQGQFEKLLGLSAAQAYWINFGGSVLLTISVLIFVQRRLTYPVSILIDAVQRINDGNLEILAPVVTSDELGRLTEHINDMTLGLKEREVIRATFRRLVPDSIAAELIRDSGALVPQAREATILFTDVRGFTSISEQLEPTAILAMLNEYFGVVGAAIRRYGGVITQFQGDAVLASFNLPVRDDDHAVSAVRAALDIIEDTAKRTFGAGKVLHTRVGISSGMVVGGAVGDDDRLGYTIHGSEVNLAARLEELNKKYGTSCLVSKRVADLVGDRFHLEPLGQLEIRGRAQPVGVFKLL